MFIDIKYYSYSNYVTVTLEGVLSDGSDHAAIGKLNYLAISRPRRLKRQFPSLVELTGILALMGVQGHGSKPNSSLLYLGELRVRCDRELRMGGRLLSEDA